MDALKELLKALFIMGILYIVLRYYVHIPHAGVMTILKVYAVLAVFYFIGFLLGNGRSRQK